MLTDLNNIFIEIYQFIIRKLYIVLDFVKFYTNFKKPLEC